MINGRACMRRSLSSQFKHCCCVGKLGDFCLPALFGCGLQCKMFGCLAFPSFEVGVAFMRYVALNKLQPASIRLMDKRQTQCGSLFKVTPVGMAEHFLGCSIKAFRQPMCPSDSYVCMDRVRT